MTEEEFHDNIPTWIKADIKDWTHITLLAYFCNKYETKTNARFRLVRAAKGPTMGKEASDFAKLFRTLAPEDYKLLPKSEKDKVRYLTNLKIYNYINWMFDYKFRSGDKSVTGTRIFLTPSIINDFERMYSNFLAKQEKTNKIENLISWCKAEEPQIFETHQLERIEDLGIIQKYADLYKLDDSSLERKILYKAKEMGLI
jgi:hypothetical protein